MKIHDYLRNKIMLILLQTICLVSLLLYLKVIGTGNGELTLIGICWISVFFIYLCIHFLRYRNKHRRLYSLMNSLDQKYLFPELVKPGWDLEERMYYDLMKMAMTSMTSQVSTLCKEQEEYRGYMEQWSHEMKGPLTAVNLLCQNHPGDSTRKILQQTKRMEHCLDQVLYYARLDKAEQDYIIRQTTLADIVDHVLTSNMQLLIQNEARIETDDLDYPVRTDEKWLAFMLGQVLLNSLRYKKQQPVISFSGHHDKHGTWLSVSDQGIGIPAADLPRIFQKGFTGSNGRRYNSTTGIGLWLCQNLCDKLGIRIRAESTEGEGTTIRFLFPDQNKKS